jgi:DNA repair protein RecO (recombination protein O)
VTHLCALARLLPERDPHPALQAELESILDDFDDPHSAAARIARFELRLLAELGFGLDLSECAATGSRRDLIYVSPKSGRAISRAAGAPWQDKLLRLPGFLNEGQNDEAISADDLAHGFALTGFFLARHVLDPRGAPLPEARTSFIAAVMREADRAPVE